MRYAYVGSRTTKERNARGEGLSVYEILESTGEWKKIQTIKVAENPSFQCLTRRKSTCTVYMGITHWYQLTK